MEFKKIWNKLFFPKTQAEALALHVAGATVRHRNPFEDLVVPRNEDELTREFSEIWIAPYYLKHIFKSNPETINVFVSGAGDFTVAITKKLLGYFDWRAKLTAAYFAAINNHQELEDIIGKLLLKSEVCYAGTGYSIALAIFGTAKSKDYLKQYLQYYLSRKDLWFDQAEAFCALEYIDKNEAKLFLNSWDEFIADKGNWNLEGSRKRFLASIENILRIRKMLTDLK
ncbi:DUF6000 family protein [Ferruginibacter sp. SUN106]|uniref:DUF6000 family protein n=1 Tax=Ferruginibacter sp. SUN106 TaxID=2978348 RepID=UPI003D35D612